MAGNEKIKALREQRRKMEREFRENVMAERMAMAANARAERRDKMTAEQLAKETELDGFYLAVFSTDAGQIVLNDLSEIRPIVADGIKERIARANASTGNTEPNG